MTLNVNTDELDEDKIEVEIIDDTPPEDRNRKPLPADTVASLEAEDDVENYSDAVKERINKMKRAWHDERRAREAALRELDASAAITRNVLEERNQLRQQLTSGEAWALDRAKKLADVQVLEAKRAYKEAYESGDSEAIAVAQQAMTQAGIGAKESESFRAQFTPQYWEHVDKINPIRLQQPNDVLNKNQPAEQIAPSSDTVEWQKRNPWFGTDDEMTAFALGVHQKVIRSGMKPETAEYFESIDARMREVFPKAFQAKTNIRSNSPATVVAPVSRTPRGNKVVLTQSQVAVARRLGITPEAYAAELKKMGSV